MSLYHFYFSEQMCKVFSPISLILTLHMSGLTQQFLYLNEYCKAALLERCATEISHACKTLLCGIFLVLSMCIAISGLFSKFQTDFINIVRTFYSFYTEQTQMCFYASNCIYSLCVFIDQVTRSITLIYHGLIEYGCSGRPRD